MRRSRPASVVLAVLMAWLSACTSYRQIEVEQVEGHGSVWVTLSSGEQKEIHDPRVEKDSLRGWQGGGNLGPGGAAPVDSVAFPLDDVIAVGEERTNALGTAATVLGLTAAVTVLVGAVLVVGCTGDRDFSCGFWEG